MLRLYDIYHPAFNSRPFKCKSEKNMPFRPQRLNSVLIQKLDAFLKANSFPDLYRAYAWNKDTYENDFPDIHRLELHIATMDQTTGITISDVKCVAKWGGNWRNQGRIAGRAGRTVVLPPHTLHTPEGAAVAQLQDEPLAPLLKLDASVTQAGPTYLTKVLRFGLPQEYGAIDTRCVRVFGCGNAEIRQQDWIALRARNNGSGWFIVADKAWPEEYATWINILRYFASQLPANCPHPRPFVAARLRTAGGWECADVEMALFSYASQFAGRGA